MKMWERSKCGGRGGIYRGVGWCSNHLPRRRWRARRAESCALMLDQPLLPLAPPPRYRIASARGRATPPPRGGPPLLALLPLAPPRRYRITSTRGSHDPSAQRPPSPPPPRRWSSVGRRGWSRRCCTRGRNPRRGEGCGGAVERRKRKAKQLLIQIEIGKSGNVGIV